MATRNNPRGDREFLCKEGINKAKQIRNNPTVYGMFEILYNGILFHDMRPEYEGHELSDVMKTVVRRYWVPWAKDLIDTIQTHGFVVVSSRKVDINQELKLPGSVKTEKKSVKVSVPYVVPLEMVDISYTIDKGYISFEAWYEEQKGGKTYLTNQIEGEKMQIFRELHQTSFNMKTQTLVGKMLALEDDYNAFMMFEQHLMSMISSVSNPPTFLRVHDPREDETLQTLAVAAMFPQGTEKSDVHKIEQNMRVMAPVSSRDVFWRTTHGDVVDPASNIRILPAQLEYVPRSLPTTLPIENTGMFRERFAQSAATILGVPMSLALSLSTGNKYNTVNMSEPSRRLCQTRMKIIQDFNDIASSVWEQLYGQSGVKFVIPLIPVIDNE